MVMIRLWWLVPKVKPQRSKRLLSVRFKERTLKKLPKLMQTLKELRCEGVEFNALELVYCKDILAQLRLSIFCKME
jgi:hypothetical protein